MGAPGSVATLGDGGTGDGGTGVGITGVGITGVGITGVGITGIGATEDGTIGDGATGDRGVMGFRGGSWGAMGAIERVQGGATALGVGIVGVI